MATLPRTGQALPAGGAERALAEAFQDFNQAAGLLERSYGELRGELGRLRRELRLKNRENLAMRERLETILAGLPCGVLVIEGTRIHAVNRAAQQLLAPWQEDTAELGGELPACLAPALNATPNEEFSLEIEEPVTRSLGVMAAPLEASGEQPGDRLLIVRDTTAETRRRREHEAARNLRALAEMSALLAHEIRNPLAGMELFAGLLNEAMLDGSEEKCWVEHLQAGLRLLSATVNNILHLHSAPPPELAPLGLERFLRATVDFLQPLAHQRGLAIELDHGAGPVEVAADGPRLQQVIFNMALNALRAMTERGGGLRLTARPAGRGQIRLDLTDGGAGIAAQDLAKIFEPGYSTQAGSPGLGLAVCRKIVEQHGGSITVTSEPGVGTTFSIFLWRWGATA